MKEAIRLPDIFTLLRLSPSLAKGKEVLLVPVAADLPRDHQTYHFILKSLTPEKPKH